MHIEQGSDLTTNNLGYKRVTSDFRVIPATSYPLGALCRMSALDLQVFPDAKTVEIAPVGANGLKLMGIVSNDWSGFDGAGGTFVSAASGARGTQGVKLTLRGYHPGVLADLTAGSTVTDGTKLTSSATQAGRVQGVAAVGFGIVGYAMLPSAGLFSSLTQAAQAQASQFTTIATPAAGDTIGLTYQIPDIISAPGVVQKRTTTVLLTVTSAGSVTLAAAALVAALNADPIYSKYYVATNVAGALTSTALATALFGIYPATPFGSLGLSSVPQGYTLNLSGAAGNGLTFAATKTGAGGTTNTANAASLAAGAGYIGILPCHIDLLG